jgi:hypothetical protein
MKLLNYMFLIYFLLIKDVLPVLGSVEVEVNRCVF